MRSRLLLWHICSCVCSPKTSLRISLSCLQFISKPLFLQGKTAQTFHLKFPATEINYFSRCLQKSRVPLRTDSRSSAAAPAARPDLPLSARSAARRNFPVSHTFYKIYFIIIGCYFVKYQADRYSPDSAKSWSKSRLPPYKCDFIYRAAVQILSYILLYILL